MLGLSSLAVGVTDHFIGRLLVGVRRQSPVLDSISLQTLSGCLCLLRPLGKLTTTPRHLSFSVTSHQREPAYEPVL